MRTHAKGAIVTALVISLSLPLPAYAQVDRSDVILGESIEQRQMSDEDCPNISAPRAILMDSEGNVLYERHADEESKIASTTKIMTAHLALKYAKENGRGLDDTITISSDSAGITGSTAGLQSGDRLTLHDLLLCAMLPSGNDAADALARYAGHLIDPSTTDALSTFVDEMNREAESLGMTNTLYRNPHGLDVDQYAGDQHSTARDLAILARTAMEDEDFREIVGTSEATIPVTGIDNITRNVTLTNTDTLLSSYNGAIGVKTGTTQLAGSCFVGSMSDQSQTYYTVVLGNDTASTTFADTRTLYDWAQAHDVTYDVAKGHDAVSVTIDGRTEKMPAVADVACRAYSDRTVTGVLEDWTPITTYDLLGDVSQSVVFNEPEGGVSVGDVIGTVTYKQGDDTLAERDIIAAEDVPEPSEAEQLLIAIGRAFRSILGQPTTATSDVIEAHDDADDGAFQSVTADRDGSSVTTGSTNREPNLNITI